MKSLAPDWMASITIACCPIAEHITILALASISLIFFKAWIPSISGIVITMYNGRLNLSTQVLAELKRYYADKLFKTPVVRNVKLSEAPSFGQPIFYHDKYSKGSLAYMEIAKELVSRVL